VVVLELHHGTHWPIVPAAAASTHHHHSADIESSRSDDGMAAHATSEPEMAVDVTTICRATYCLWTLGMILLTNRYMVQGGYDQNRSSSGVWSSFVDFRGHWLLILLGSALFAMMCAF
jgi:hypothetical protein